MFGTLLVRYLIPVQETRKSLVSIFLQISLNNSRTFVIWMVSLAVHWQAFYWQHLIGFAVLIYGMCEYNGVVPSCRRRQPNPVDSESQVVNAEAERMDPETEDQ